MLPLASLGQEGSHGDSTLALLSPVPLSLPTPYSSVLSRFICAYIWRRKWQATPVSLPGKSHGQRSLVGCSPWGCEESDTTERLYICVCVCVYLLSVCVYLLRSQDFPGGPAINIPPFQGRGPRFDSGSRN